MSSRREIHSQAASVRRAIEERVRKRFNLKVKPCGGFSSAYPLPCSLRQIVDRGLTESDTGRSGGKGDRYKQRYLRFCRSSDLGHVAVPGLNEMH